MKLGHTAAIAAPADRVWAAVMDIPVAATCLPGAAAVTPAGLDRYDGQLLVQAGPVRLVLDGVVAVVARDDAARRATFRADAKDARLGGTVEASIEVTLAERGATTVLEIAADVRIGGRIGDLAQGALRRRSDELLAQFTRCLARSLAA